jgi:transcription elongation factor Elf1
MKSPATSPTFSAHTDRLVRSFFCPRCDDLMVAPALSQHVNHDVVRHWWSCESCGHEFRTTVQLPTLPAEALQQAMA